MVSLNRIPRALSWRSKSFSDIHLCNQCSPTQHLIPCAFHPFSSLSPSFSLLTHSCCFVLLSCSLSTSLSPATSLSLPSNPPSSSTPLSLSCFSLSQFHPPFVILLISLSALSDQWVFFLWDGWVLSTNCSHQRTSTGIWLLRSTRCGGIVYLKRRRDQDTATIYSCGFHNCLSPPPPIKQKQSNVAYPLSFTVSAFVPLSTWRRSHRYNTLFLSLPEGVHTGTTLCSSLYLKAFTQV